MSQIPDLDELKARFLAAIERGDPPIILPPEFTGQEREIIAAIRRRDGRQDGDFAGLFALWARGELRVLFDPLDRREVQALIAKENRRRGVGFGRPHRATL